VKNNGDKTMKKRKRLKPFSYRVGPDYYGCYNTGTAPTIYHWGLEEWDKKDRRYIVGPKLFVLEVGHDFFNLNLEHKRIYRRKNETAYIYKTATKAFEKWEEMCKEAINRNLKIHEEVQKLKRKG
jgi:hypothetical protein